MTTDVAESQAAAPASQTDAGTASDEAASILAALDGDNDTAEPTDAQATEGTEAKTDGTDTDEPEDIEALLKTEVRESIAAKARADALKELEEKQATETKEREKKQAESSRRDGLRQAYRQTAPALRQWANEQGLEEAETNKLLNTFTTFHAQALDAASWELTDKLVEALRSRLPEDERESFNYDGTNDDLETFLGDYESRVTKSARKGYLSEAEVKQRVADEKVALFKRLRENPSLLNRSAGPRRSSGGTATSGGALTAEEAATLPIEELRRRGYT